MPVSARRAAAAAAHFAEAAVPVAAGLTVGLYLLSDHAPPAHLPLLDTTTSIHVVAVIAALCTVSVLSLAADRIRPALYRRLGRDFGPCPHCGVDVEAPHLSVADYTPIR